MGGWSRHSGRARAGQGRAGQSREGHREWGVGVAIQVVPGQDRAAVNRVECEDSDQGRIQGRGDGGYGPSLDRFFLLKHN